jgi:peptidoglycan hydrolase-like protein with peptidoglycan-binding domain
MRFVLLAVIGLTVTGSVSADENVRAVQEKLRDGGFYSGEMDGAYSSQLAAALTRYQIRNGLPIRGQLDVETSKALGAKPAVAPNTAATEQSSSETWRQLRRSGSRGLTYARRLETVAIEGQETSSPRVGETPRSHSGAPSQESFQDSSSKVSKTAKLASAPLAAASDTGFATADVSPQRIRDYLAAFVLAGLDRNVGAETEFFADRVQYYDQGVMDRENIREDLKRYDERWPERHFWVAGTIDFEPQSDNRVRVTFPLGFKLRNGNKTLEGKVDKTVVLEPSGGDLQIVAVNEKKVE